MLVHPLFVWVSTYWVWPLFEVKIFVYDNGHVNKITA